MMHSHSVLGRSPVSRSLSRALWLWVVLVAWGICNWAQGTVVDCTEQSLQSALANGGLVTFSADCSLTISQALYVGSGTTSIIDAGGHRVTISGGGLVPLFSVAGNLTLRGITLANGKSSSAGGALYVSPTGVVLAQNCTFVSNSVAGANGLDGAGGSTSSNRVGGNGGAGAPGTSVVGGAICNQGTLTLTNCSVLNNTAVAGNGGRGGDGGGGGGTLSEGGNGGAGGAGGSSYGGAVYNSGYLSLTNCTVARNTASGGTGGVGGAPGPGTFTGLAGGGAAGGGGYGGGIYNGQTIVIQSSALSGNSSHGGNSAAGGTRGSHDGDDGPDGASAFGGGLCNASWGAVTNCTFYTDTATGGTGGNGGDGSGTFPRAGRGGNGGNGLGGGLQNFGTLTVVNCTVLVCSAYGGTNGLAGSGNFGGGDGQPGQAQGGNVSNLSGNFTLMNSLFAWAPSGGCGYGTFSDAGYNLTTDTTISLGNTSFPNIPDPKLGGFGMYGGPTATVPLLTNSPAIDKVPNNLSPATDQRGVPRPLRGLPTSTNSVLGDIGAYESDASSPPVIMHDLADQTNRPSSSVTFSVWVVGASPLRYQWRLQGTPIANAASSSYTILSVSSSNQGPYQVVITNNLGSVTSLVARVYLSPVITSQPTNQVVTAGTDVSFAVVAAGDPVLSYQWQFNSTNLAGATDALLQLPSVQVANIGAYTVSVSNQVGGLISSAATLNLRPTILAQPGNLSLSPGASAVFQVLATGTPPLSYQWRHNGTPISGATLGAYTNNSVQGSDAGSYLVTIANNYGATNSVAATLNVVAGLTGWIHEGTNGLAGVTLALGTNPPAVTGPDGTYSVSLPPATYQLTPVFTNYGFSPPTFSLMLTNNTENINFSGLPLIHLARLSNNAAYLYGGGITGLTYQIDISSNLIQWQLLSPTVGPVQFTDPTATNWPTRFYRLSR